MAQLVKNHNRKALSKAITLVESSLEVHQLEAFDLLQQVYIQNSKSYKIGITGTPGVGKSTFLNGIIQELLSKEPKAKVAVLAIDPSSANTSGSILGDKTRMDDIANDDRVFIRPSPAKTQLGGVAKNTIQTIQLCEAAGFDYIFIETVGVGQSETEVSDMVDIMVLLMLAGAGDELQGIKRGIMELADVLIIHKAEEENKLKAQAAAKQFSMALHLFPPKESGWNAKVLTASSIENRNLSTAWESILDYQKHAQSCGHWESNRREQQEHWVQGLIKHRAWQQFIRMQPFEEEYDQWVSRMWLTQGNPYAEITEKMPFYSD